MSRLPLFLLTIVASGAFTGPAFAQLQTLSRGNEDLQWRDAQIKVLDKQLADGQVPAELKLELEAQRNWLAGWNPKKPSAPEPTESQAPQLRKEPVVDPKELAKELREKLFDSRTPPTVDDTSALQTALMENSGDVGLRQLQMHWVDQPRYRNEYWKEIGEACGRVISLLAEEKQTEEVKWAAAFAHYRRARALAHASRAVAIQGKDVAGLDKLTAEDLKQLSDTIGESAAEIEKLVGSGHPEFFQIEIYTLRRDHWVGRALELLEKHAATVDKSAYLLEKKSLQEALGWKAAAAQTAKALKAIPTAQQRLLEIQYR